jgi:hypothetical protein
MADGDPMVLATKWGGDLVTQSNFETLLVNGNFEDWDDTAAIADGWTWIGAGYTFTRQAGARTGGAGAYYQRATKASVGAATMEQTIDLRGHADLDALGHMGREFTGSIWLREQGAGTTDISLVLRGYSGISLIESGSTVTADPMPAGAWTQYTATYTIANATVDKINFEISFNVASGTGAQQIEIDDAMLYRTYTFANNPSMPDNQHFDVPGREYIRTVGADLLMGRAAGSTAKYELPLRFGLIGLDQLKELRSFALLDKPVHLTANHPHFPVYWQGRIVGRFKFGLMRGASFGSGQYAGVLNLSEL